MKFGNFFSVMVLAICFAMPVRAGIISGIVTAPVGIGFTAAGIGLALKAVEQYGNTHGTQKYTSKIEGWSTKLVGSKNLTQSLAEVESDLNGKFGKYTTTVAYGTSSAVCLIIGAKILF